tara:strand:- start:74 stop:2125 length:2052 start_codon:yes stop_codon:yes gene_type:complete
MPDNDNIDIEGLKEEAKDIGSVLSNAFNQMAANIQDEIAASLDTTSTFADNMSKSILRDIKQFSKAGDKLAGNAIKMEAGLSSMKDLQKQKIDNETKLLSLQNKINASKMADIDIGEEVLEQYQQAINYNEVIKDSLEEQIKAQAKVDEKMGGMGNLVKGIDSIPGAGKLLETDKALVSMGKAAAKGGSKMKVMGAGMKAMGGALKKNIYALVILELVKAIGKVDEEVTEMSKGLNMSKSEATALRGELSIAANNSQDVFVTTTKLIAAQATLNKHFGTAALFQGEILVQATKLLEKTKLSGEAVAGLAGQSIVAGESFEDNYENTLLTSYEMQRTTGISVDLRNVMAQVGGTSGALRAQLGGSTEEIAKAVTQAEMLGMNMKETAKAGRSLLDFESSISAELEAELLTGKQLNLEKARLAALTGDQVTLQQELANNMGSFEEFSNMNVLQQEALAKAVGMTSDQVSDVLYKQEIQGKTARELRALGKDELADRLEATTAQDKFNAMILKLKGMLADIVTPLIPLLDLIMSVLTPVLALLSLLDPIVKTLQMMTTGVVDVVKNILTFGGAGFEDTLAAHDNATSSIEDTWLKPLGYEGQGMAAGGIVTATPGGTQVTIGEGGQSEAVIPLDRASEFGLGKNQPAPMTPIIVKSVTQFDSFGANNPMAPNGRYQSYSNHDTKFA